ncbi:MAG: DNA gyrase inhibitor YacG [Myxococcales bacterium]|nr:DNA gyrase inhibitor YacG [Myxococcales bacterium]
MGKTNLRKCPVCEQEVRPDTKYRPFCSPRCKDVDLGSWLQESYRISRPLSDWDVAATINDPSSTDDN